VVAGPRRSTGAALPARSTDDALPVRSRSSEAAVPGSTYPVAATGSEEEVSRRRRVRRGCGAAVPTSDSQNGQIFHMGSSGLPQTEDIELAEMAVTLISSRTQ